MPEIINSYFGGTLVSLNFIRPETMNLMTGAQSGKHSHVSGEGPAMLMKGVTEYSLHHRTRYRFNRLDARLFFPFLIRKTLKELF